jgi:hypothetical protein
MGCARAKFCEEIATGRLILCIDCSRTTDLGYRLQTEGGFCALSARGGLILLMDCAGRAEFGHGLHREGFVIVTALCVVIVFVIVVFLYFCGGYVGCCANVGLYDFNVAGAGKY